MASGNAENKSAFESGIFLKVDQIEPVYADGYSPFDYTHLNGVKVWIGNSGYFFTCDQYTICDPDEVREDGRRQVVALMNELINMTIADNNKLFGYGLTHNILNHFSYEEIVKKMDDWKKAKDEIHVRDEVYNKTLETKFVITNIYTPCDGDAIVNGLKKDGTAVKGLLLCGLKKTGLHVDDLDSYLEV